MTHDEKLKLIDDLSAATGAGDWERAESMLTEDFFASEADHLPMKGRFTGRGGLRELYTLVFTMVDASGIKRIETTTGGDYAVVILEIQFAQEGLAPAETCEMFRFRDGKVCEIKPYYYNPAAFDAAVAAKKAGNA